MFEIQLHPKLALLVGFFVCETVNSLFVVWFCFGQFDLGLCHQKWKES